MIIRDNRLRLQGFGAATPYTLAPPPPVATMQSGSPSAGCPAGYWASGDQCCKADIVSSGTPGVIDGRAVMNCIPNPSAASPVVPGWGLSRIPTWAKWLGAAVVVGAVGYAGYAVHKKVT